MNTTLQPFFNKTTQNQDVITQVFWPIIQTPIGAEILIAIHIFTMLISIPGNMMTSWIIIRNDTLHEEPAYLLICSVSCADLMVSLIGQPLNISAISRIHLGLSPQLELTLYFSVWGFCGASAFGVVIVTVDRFLCIIYPMHYSRLLSRQRTFILILIQWVCGLAYGLLPVIDMKESAFPTAIASLITLLLMALCMTAVYIEIYKNIRRLKEEQPKKHRRGKRRENNATLTIALIVLAFCICWFPYIITNFITTCIKFPRNSPVHGLYYWFLGLGCWNSACNVIIYGFKNTTLKREALKILVCKGVLPSTFTTASGKSHLNLEDRSSIKTIHNPQKGEETTVQNTKTIFAENSDVGMTNYGTPEHMLLQIIPEDLSCTFAQQAQVNDKSPEDHIQPIEVALYKNRENSCCAPAVHIFVKSIYIERSLSI